MEYLVVLQNFSNHAEVGETLKHVVIDVPEGAGYDEIMSEAINWMDPEYDGTVPQGDILDSFDSIDEFLSEYNTGDASLFLSYVFTPDFEIVYQAESCI